jgi:hypothetical protein
MAGIGGKFPLWLRRRLPVQYCRYLLHGAQSTENPDMLQGPQQLLRNADTKTAGH